MAAFSKALREQFNGNAPALSVPATTRDKISGKVHGMPPAPNFEHIILEKLKGRPGGLSLIEVRASLKAGGKVKPVFDQAVLALYKDRRVYLDRHDHPMRLSDAERRDLVSDEAGNYYVGITLRSDIE